jgi:hypothetical protein
MINRIKYHCLLDVFVKVKNIPQNLGLVQMGSVGIKVSLPFL